MTQEPQLERSGTTPGSPKAAKRGCICGSDINRLGRGSAFGDGRFVIDSECPEHGRGCSDPSVAAIQIKAK